MAIVIRMKRMGTKKKPHHRIVVTKKDCPRDGKYLEALGVYDPSYEPAVFKVDKERVAHWVKNGAIISEGLKKLFKTYKIL